MIIILEQYITAIMSGVVHARNILTTFYITFWEVSRHPPLVHILFLLTDIFDFRLITTVGIKMDTILISEQNSNYWSGKYWTLSDIILVQRTKHCHKLQSVVTRIKSRHCFYILFDGFPIGIPGRSTFHGTGISCFPRALCPNAELIPSSRR